ncbi:uncharacterized protein LOC117327451 [Pecten maximus]|uniref:uncharacterized protein LOC117327451 n=1 Tax=Pecten maximus TaxID=6579 RepID=UPI00145834A1|nr:uncharacterized protein LOC117327451 [Pecten maximus]
MTTPCLDDIMNGFDYEGIRNRETLKEVVRELRRHLVRYFETQLSPEKHTWGAFLNIIKAMTAIPLSALEKTEDIADIMNILKTKTIRKRRFQPYSCLMKSVKQIDSQYAKSVGPLYNKIVMLDKQYVASVKVEMASHMDNYQMTKDPVGRLPITNRHSGFYSDDDTSSEEDERGGERIRRGS